jgi:hypothetical protein
MDSSKREIHSVGGLLPFRIGISFSRYIPPGEAFVSVGAILSGPFVPWRLLPLGVMNLIWKVDRFDGPDPVGG